MSDSGLQPIPHAYADRLESAEGFVEVRYSGVYRCALCGFTPHKFGCVPAMLKHLEENHSKTFTKPPWLTSYCHGDIIRALNDHERQ